MAQESAYTAIDIGTSKIAVVIAQQDSKQKETKILGHATVLSRGVKKGIVVDIEQVTQCLEEALGSAEKMAGVAATEVLVSIGGPHISSLNSHGIVAVIDPKNEIVQDDVDRVIEAAKAVSQPVNRQILYVSPKQFTVDGQNEIHSPLGMSGVRLEVDCHIITASATNIRNIDRITESVDVQSQGYIFAGDASAQTVMTSSEKDLGVAVIDIGAGKTDLAVYLEGALHHAASIPVGAKHITNDIAVGLRLPLEVAEEMKLYLSDNVEQADQKGALTLPDISAYLAHGEASDFTAKNVYESIIVARVEEIVQFVQTELEKAGYLKSLPAGLICTGGGARTIGLMQICRAVLPMPVRIGTPTSTLVGLSQGLHDPKYATVLGLLNCFTRLNTTSVRTNGSSRLGLSRSAGSFAASLKKFFKQFLP
jgi:cell division protein FtsA